MSLKPHRNPLGDDVEELVLDAAQEIPVVGNVVGAVRAEQRFERLVEDISESNKRSLSKAASNRRPIKRTSIAARTSSRLRSKRKGGLDPKNRYNYKRPRQSVLHIPVRNARPRRPVPPPRLPPRGRPIAQLHRAPYQQLTRYERDRVRAYWRNRRNKRGQRTYPFHYQRRWY